MSRTNPVHGCAAAANNWRTNASLGLACALGWISHLPSLLVSATEQRARGQRSPMPFLTSALLTTANTPR